MLAAKLFANPDKEIRLLCLGAHCDDVEIGCGGTLLKWLSGYGNIHVTWVVFSSTASRKREAELGASLFTKSALSLDLHILDFRDGFLPTEGIRLKEAFERLKREVATPDLIFTHYRNDRHQDHRAVSDLTWNTFRNHLILEYEIPKWDGDMGVPNCFTKLDQELGRQKIAYLQETYNSQTQKKWFTDDLFWSLMRIRGMECNSESMIAEAFYCRKMVLD